MEFNYISPKREVHSLQFEKWSAEGDKVSMTIESFRYEVTSGGRDHILLKVGPRACYSGTCQKGNSPAFLGDVWSPVFDHLCGFFLKKILLAIEIPHVVTCVCCLSSCYCAPPRIVWLHVLCIL